MFNIRPLLDGSIYLMRAGYKWAQKRYTVLGEYGASDLFANIQNAFNEALWRNDIVCESTRYAPDLIVRYGLQWGDEVSVRAVNEPPEYY
jgi:hypothetical protein